MPLDTSLSQLLANPTPDALWNLRADLLALSDHLPPAERARADWSLGIATRFHQYLSDLASTTTARDFSQWASQLDMGSVGLLALQDLVTDRERLMKKLFLGGLSEALMVLASRQYVKAWKSEATQVHHDTLWWLFEALWRLSREAQSRPLRGPTPCGDRNACSRRPVRGQSPRPPGCSRRRPVPSRPRRQPRLGRSAGARTVSRRRIASRPATACCGGVNAAPAW